MNDIVRLYRSYENCRRLGVAILDMQMSKVPVICDGHVYWCQQQIKGDLLDCISSC